MTIRLDLRLLTLAALAALCVLPACGKKRPPALAGAQPGAGGASQSAPAREPAEPLDQGPDVRAMPGEGGTASDLGPGGSALANTEGGPLDDVHFELDSAALNDAARATLEKHALWLQAHRDVRVTIEGHCDERGTVEYNLALGEQRARAARDYLASLGVAADRMRTVSFGKERPLDTGQNEAAYARNRRAHFVVGR
jgi:peptidoglycan-associated lipoprotein